MPKRLEMVQRPAKHGLQPLLKAMPLPPTKPPRDLGRTDRVALVMAGAIGRPGVQAPVGSASGTQAIQESTDHLHRLHVVLHVEPIPHVLAIAVQRKQLTGHSIEDHHRDQLLGKLQGAVVVGAVGEIAGVANLLEVEHCGSGVPQQPPHQRPANEAGAAIYMHPVNGVGQQAGHQLDRLSGG